MKKMLFITGTRADFGKMKILMKEVDNDPHLECYIYVTGMHMLSRYGYTYDEVHKAGFNKKNIFVHMNQIADSNAAMDMILANTVQGLGRYIREFRPDLIVIHGDRVEALAGAIVGALNNILVAHIEGGELSGTVDELIRHAITKLVHLHFVANDEAQKRLIQMGEDENAVFVIGSPDVDIMLSDKLPDISRIRKYYDIAFKEYLIFSYHPVTTELDKLQRNIKIIMESLKESGLNFVVIYPNNDSGSNIILDTISSLEGNKRFKLFPSLRFEYFLTLLKNAKAIIGNSSAGIRTAPAYGIPVINIGTRQMNRFNHSSIIDVSEDKDVILKSLKNLPQKTAPSLHFGKGNSAGLFMKHMHQESLWATKSQKQFKDLVDAGVKDGQ